MGLEGEFQKAANFVESDLVLDRDVTVNVFETTIRVLGGLISAHHLSGRATFLKRATALALKLKSSFESNSGVPLSDLKLANGQCFNPKWTDKSTFAEATSIQVELKALAHLTNDEALRAACDHSMHVIFSALDRYWCASVDANGQ